MPNRTRQGEGPDEVSNNDLAGMIEAMASDLRLVKHYCTGGDDPAKGLVVRVDRLEQFDTQRRLDAIERQTAGHERTLKQQTWWYRAACSAGLVGVAGWLMEHFSKH